MKDLSILGVDLNNVLMIDDYPQNVYPRENCIEIAPFETSADPPSVMNDRCLSSLVSLFQAIRSLKPVSLVEFIKEEGSASFIRKARDPFA